MKKALLLTLLFAMIAIAGFSQTGSIWSANTESRDNISKDKAVARLAYPKQYKLFNLNIEPLRQQLFSIVDNSARRSTVISLPNADGGIEEFEVYEASNFDKELQARFPEIRAYSGKGITDRYATLKLSISPQGIQTMVFRTEKPDEFIEPYSRDHTVYSVFTSQREKNKLPWVCTTVDTQLAGSLNEKVYNSGSNIVNSSAGELRTMRLAQSCNGEYANYFGATSAAQVALVLAAYNATLTRCNGCYEKDLALHLNLIANTTQVIYYDPATDPYTTLANWNLQLQQTLTAVIGSPNYDIGHMFGASGGGGNAGCIGCVCVDPPTNNSLAKGAGITSPADGIPQGDNFDIDYVVHEVGHQLGGNHSFTFSNEGTIAQTEVGAGITIMGYAGITSYDPAPHSIDIYTGANILQIQNNLATKTCPITTNISANNATPVVAPLSNYTIPMQTPFALTGSATDANGDPLTYCWEQNDLHGGQTGSNSVAYAAKPVGPNFLTFPATASPTRLFPKLSTILAGAQFTGPFPGGDAICNIEYLSNVGRLEKFRLTVRDNCPYIPVTGPGTGKIGQTAYQDMTLTIDGTTGPFAVTSPNTNVSWPELSSQTITWSVNGTAGAPINCANVKISMSIDGGTTFPYVLAASTANDGTEVLTIPAGTTTTTARIKIESIGNIFFDIDDANFTITPPSSCTAASVTTQPSNASVCIGSNTSFSIVAAGTGPLTYQWQLSTTGCGGTFTNITNAGVYSGATTPTLTITGATAGMAGYAYRCQVTGNCAPLVATSNCAVLTINTSPSITGQPVSSSICVGNNTSFSVTATGTSLTYAWQVSTNGGGTFGPVANGGVYSGATTAVLTITGATAGMNAYLYRVVVSGTCSPSTTSNNDTLLVYTAPSITTQPVAPAPTCATGSLTISVVAGGTSPLYQWQVSTAGAGGPWSNVSNGGVYSGANNATLTLTGITAGMNGYMYRAVVTNLPACTAATSNGVAIVVTPQPVVTLSASPYLKLLPGLTTTITASVNPPVGFTSVWTWNGAPLTVTGNSYLVDLDHLGTYTVVATIGSCTSLPASITISDSASGRLFVYPSPNNGQFTISYYSPGASSTNKTYQLINIYDSYGRRVLSDSYTVSQPYQLHKMDMRRHGAGVYYIVLREANGNKIRTGVVVIK